MLPLPDTLVFDRSAAFDLGWSDPSLTRAARAEKIIRLRRGQFTRPGADVERAGAVAASRSISGSVISHRSALIAHGLPLVGARARWPELTVSPRGTGSAHRALLHRACLPSEDLTIVDGVLTTSVARTLLDVARSRPAVTAVPAIDAALHCHLVSLDDLDDVARRCWNWPGIGRAQRSLRLVDGRSESALESVSRLVMGWLHLPVPDLQPVVRDEHGLAVARTDFYWDEFGVAGEADGRVKYAVADESALEREKDRQERAEDLGVEFARWGWTLPWRQPRTLKHKIESAFARGRARDRSGLPRQWSISRTDSITGREEVIV